MAARSWRQQYNPIWIEVCMCMQLVCMYLPIWPQKTRRLKSSRLGTGKGYGLENFVSERDMKIAALMKNAKS